jgi:hypothetical protein
MITITDNIVQVTITETGGTTVISDVVTQAIISSVGVQGVTGAMGLVPVFTRQNDIAVTTGKARFYFDTTRVLSQIRASVGTPSTGASVVVGVYVNGSSIGTVSIPATQNTATTPISFTVNAGDYATVSILSVGTTYAGGDLTVTLSVN